MLPQSNATLTSITGAGKPADWELAATAGAGEWTGALDAYYNVRRERVGDDAGGLIKRESLVVENNAVTKLIDEDDTLAFTFDGQALTAKVRVVERRDLGGALPNYLRTTRLTLEVVPG